MRTLTLRTIFERATILRLLEEPEFEHNLALSVVRDGDIKNDHYFAVFVFTVEPHEDGCLLLRVASTTVVGIQRYTTKRLYLQGVDVTSKPNESGLLTETLRAHFRAQEQDTSARLGSIGPRGMPLGWFKKHFPNGAGVLPSPPEFVVSDPELEELEKLFKTPDTRSAS